MVIQFKRQTRQEVASKRNIPLRCYLYQLNEFPTVIVLESGGYSTGAEQWLKSKARKNKLLHVFNQGGFSALCGSRPIINGMNEAHKKGWKFTLDKQKTFDKPSKLFKLTAPNTLHQLRKI